MSIKKRASVNWNIIISLILGVMILAIALNWIFQEYFNEDDINFEACRQSIVLREQNLDFSPGGITLASFNGDFPLKCKTSVVEVDEKRVNELEEIIADEIVKCWALYSNGDTTPFPKPRILNGDGLSYSACVPCSRISLTEDARKELIKNNGNIDISLSLDKKMSKDSTYFSYLNNSGNKFSAFVGGERGFDREGEEFSIDVDLSEADSVSDVFSVYSIENRENGAIADVVMNQVTLPKFYFEDKGDLIISYGVTMFSGPAEFGNHIPYLFYFQIGQNEDPFGETKNQFIGSRPFCETWEGIPA